MSDDPLYSKPVLRLAAAATGAGQLPEPNIAGSAHNPVCGDRVSVTMRLDKSGRISKLAHETKACVLAQASSSILGAHLKGTDETSVRLLRDAVTAMLDGSKPPAKPFADYGVLKGVAAHKNRHICVLLPIDAVLGAFSVAEPLEITNPRPKRTKR